MGLRHLCCCAAAEDGADGAYSRFDDRLTYRPPTLTRVGLSDFVLLQVIGRGTYGKVLLVQHTASSEVFAMKSMRKADVVRREQVAHVMTELSVLQRAQHPFIAQLHCSFQTPAKLFIVLAFYAGGELFFHLRRERRFKESRVRLYAAEVALALQALHRLDIAYRDLKPENVLLDAAGHVRLSDFGLAKERISSIEGGARTCCGTPSYMAPEVLLGTGHSFPVDFWGLGTLVFEMLVGTPPHYSRDLQTMYHSILYGDLRIPSFVSTAARKLLLGLLQRVPARRFGSPSSPQPHLHRTSFFRPLSFARVLARGYTPEFRPVLADSADTDNFAVEFTAEPAVDSLDDRCEHLAADHAAEIDAALAAWDCIATLPTNVDVPSSAASASGNHGHQAPQ